MKKRVRPRAGWRRWLWPALALLIALSPTDGRAQGTIVYGQFPLTPPGPPGTTSFPEDSQGWRVAGELGFPPATYTLTVNGQALYTFTSTGAYVGVYPASSLSGVIGVPLDQFGANNALPLAAGQEIGPGAAGYQWFSDPSFGSDLSATYDGGADGPLQVGLFTGLESAYLGLQFQEGGQTYYGWARVGVPYAGLDAVWLYDYAYETVPNTPILAGQGEVPEPATLSLLLVFGAVFWLVRKRSTALFTFNEKKPPPQIPPLPPAIEGSLLPRKGECYTLLYTTLRPFAISCLPRSVARCGQRTRPSLRVVL